jgi:hypothetical protein
LYKFRAGARLRGGRVTEARADLERFEKLGGLPSDVAAVDFAISAVLGEEQEGLAKLEAALTKDSHNREFLYNAACDCAVAATLVAEKHPDRRERLRKRALELLTQAIEQGYDDSAHIRNDDDLADLRELRAFQALLVRGHLERRYAAVFETSATRISRELHALAPADHLARSRELTAQGYRPASISLAEFTGIGDLQAQGDGKSTRSAGTPVPATLLAASVWHLPRIADADKERIALRQANAAAALVRLGEAERVWPLLAHSPGPRLRSWLVHRLAASGVEPKLLISRLFLEQNVAQPRSAVDAVPSGAADGTQARRSRGRSTTDVVLFETETSIRRALLLALGEFDDTSLPQPERDKLLPQIIELYRSDPDAGIHAAAAWLVLRWGGAANLAEIDAKQRGEEAPTNGRRWYVNSQGQTMVVIGGPVEFLMGSPADEPGRLPLEPLHLTRIDRSFAIGAHEVTVDQVKSWNRAFVYGPQNAPSGDCPVNAVSWYQAAEYCNWLSEQEGRELCYQANSQGKYDEGMRPVADYLTRDGYRLTRMVTWGT